MKTISPPNSEVFKDIGRNVDQLREEINQLVRGRQELKQAHRSELDEYERQMLTFLWRCRTYLSTATIARMIGLSRQRLYEKWNQHGFDTTSIDS
jgi:DNA-binding NtrC family response regulator